MDSLVLDCVFLALVKLGSGEGWGRHISYKRSESFLTPARFRRTLPGLGVLVMRGSLKFGRYNSCLYGEFGPTP